MILGLDLVMSYLCLWKLLYPLALVIREPFHRRNCEHKSRSVGIRCEKSSKQRNAAAVWLGRLAMVGFASAITVEIATGKGLLEVHSSFLRSSFHCGCADSPLIPKLGVQVLITC